MFIRSYHFAVSFSRINIFIVDAIEWRPQRSDVYAHTGRTIDKKYRMTFKTFPISVH